MKWAVLGRKPPSRLALFENFRKRHLSTMHRDGNKGGIDYMRYRYEVVKPLVVLYMREVSL
jgi:hypothetical protein